MTHPIGPADYTMRGDDCPVRLSHLWRWDRERMIVLSDAAFDLRRFHFNTVGGMVWELSDGRHSVAGIVEAVCRAFPAATRPEVEQTVANFLWDLQQEWLVGPQRWLDEYE
jgi:hypothetical protein